MSCSDPIPFICLVQLFGSRRAEESRPECWVGVKVFGNELSVFTCEDLYDQINQVSLSVAGLAVKLLKVLFIIFFFTMDSRPRQQHKKSFT